MFKYISYLLYVYVELKKQRKCSYRLIIIAQFFKFHICIYIHTSVYMYEQMYIETWPK